VEVATVAEIGGQAASREVAAKPGLPGNRLGRLTCLTLFTPIRPQWVPVLALAMWAAKWVTLAQKHILQFNFIHFVRWTIVPDMPYNGAPQEKDRLNYQYLFFESNFDGPWQHYIDAFAYCIPFDIGFVWGRGPDFPAPPPSEPLKRWIARNSMEGGTYYCAYPYASTRMVKSAIVLREKMKQLVADSARLSPTEFKTRYEQFLTECQCHF
jgi:hypothetical protein